VKELDVSRSTRQDIQVAPIAIKNRLSQQVSR
jgi:hypothetical protein